MHCSFDGSKQGKPESTKEEKLPDINTLNENEKVKLEENIIEVKEEGCLHLKHESGIYENGGIEGTKVIK